MRAQTVVAVPLGLSTAGLPVGGNFAGPLGSDGTILSLGLAVEKLLGVLPPPPSPPGCIGCTANVTNQQVLGSAIAAAHKHGHACSSAMQPVFINCTANVIAQEPLPLPLLLALRDDMFAM